MNVIRRSLLLKVTGVELAAYDAQIQAGSGQTQPRSVNQPEEWVNPMIGVSGNGSGKTITIAIGFP